MATDTLAPETTTRSWAGLDRERRVVHIGYDDVEDLLAALDGRIDASRIDAVVGIARSGIVPATIASQRLGKELFLLRCQRHGDAVCWLGDAPPPGSRVLVVDDFVSRGVTLARALAYLHSHGHPAVSMALFVDVERAQLRPDFAHPAPGFMRFAWDRRETVPAARAAHLAGATEMMRPQDETDCFGVDMDGVLLPDVRRSVYAKRLDTALRIRETLRPYAPESLPAIDWSRAHIVTGRPSCDLATTRTWLDRHGFAQCPVHCRDEKTHGHAMADVVAHKAAALTRIGVSVFLESDLMQALLLAQACPTVDVIWWGRKERVRISAARAERWTAR